MWAPEAGSPPESPRPPLGAPGLTWNSSALATSTWPSSHWCLRRPPAPHTASWPRALLRSTLSSPLSESGARVV